ncbi:MAG: hypothetical protein IJU76_10860 [Desulfovibrionaceae bacterium]|nr:hypothetical protein [Desulfovibrionaceae bacterium]
MSQVRNDSKDYSALLNNLNLILQETAAKSMPGTPGALPPETEKILKGTDLPKLPQGPLSNKNISLELLMSVIGEEERKTETNAGLSQIRANADKRAAKNAEMIKKIEENIEKLEKSGFWDKVGKAFAWIGVIAAVVASAALVATGAGALAVAGLVVACVALANQALDTVGEAVNGQGWGLTSLAGKLCGKLFGEEVEKWVKLGLDLALAVTSIVLSCGSSAGSAANAAAKATGAASKAATVSKIASGTQSAAQIASSGSKIASAAYSYQASETQADMKKLKAILEQIQMMNDLITNHLEKSLQNGQKLTETVTEIVQEQNATITNIVTHTGGAAGTA